MNIEQSIESRNRLIERQNEIMRLIQSGYRLADIAKTYGISKQRVFQIKNHGKIKPIRIIKNPRHRIIFELGGVCVRCGFSDIRALQIDHINGGGAKQSRELGAYNMYRYIERMPAEEKKQHYQVLCANCNWIKRCENKEVYNGRGDK